MGTKTEIKEELLFESKVNLVHTICHNMLIASSIVVVVGQLILI